MTIKADSLIVDARPVNYGVNHISIGAADAFGNPTLTDSFFNGLILCRSFAGTPKIAVYQCFTTSYDSTTKTLTFTLSSSISISRGLFKGAKVFIYVPYVNTTGYDLGLVEIADVTYTSGSNNTLIDSFTVITASDPGSITDVPAQAVNIAAAMYGDEIIYVKTKDINENIPALQNVFGVSASYHIFDTGYAPDDETAPPSSDEQTASLTGKPSAQGSEAGYALYAFVKNGYNPLFDPYDPSSNLDQPSNQPLTLISTFFCTYTKDYGWYRNVDTNTNNYWELMYDERRSTLYKMLERLPSFYLKDEVGQTNTDIKAFVSLFAFYYDTFRTNIDLVYDMHLPNRTNHKLLGGLLRQLGVRFEDFNNDPRYGRRLLDNIVRLYKMKGTKSGIELAAKLFTNFYATVENVPNSKNLFRNASSSTFADGNFVNDVWTTDGRTGNYATSKPIVKRVGSPFLGLTVRDLSYTNTSNVLTTGTFTAPQYFNAYSSTATAILTNGVLELSVDHSGGGNAALTSTETVRVVAGPRKVIAGEIAIVGTTTLVTKYADVVVGDFIMDDLTTYTAPGSYTDNSSAGKAITPGTYVTAITSNSTSTTLTLSSPILRDVYADDVFLASTAGGDKPSAYANAINITAVNPYAFSFYANTGGYSAATITPFVTWYDSSLDSPSAIISTGTAVTVSSTSWTRVSMVTTAPNGAKFAVPGFSIQRTTTAQTTSANPGKKFFFDAFQFEESQSVTEYSDAVSPSDFTLKIYDIQDNLNDYENLRYKKPLSYLIKDHFLTGFEPLLDPDETYEPLSVISLTKISGREVYLYDPYDPADQNLKANYSVCEIVTSPDSPQQISIGTAISSKGISRNNITDYKAGDVDQGIVVGKRSSYQTLTLVRDPNSVVTATYVASVTPNITATAAQWSLVASSITGIIPGMEITAAGIPSGAKVAAVSTAVSGVNLNRVYLTTTVASTVTNSPSYFALVDNNLKMFNTNRNNNIVLSITSSPSWDYEYSYAMGYKTYSDATMTYSGI